MPIFKIGSAKEKGASMTLFFGISATAIKAQAAVLVQNLLEECARLSDLGASPAELANKHVGISWDRNPQWFGPNRTFPTKFVLAGSAFSSGANAMAQIQSRSTELAMMVCLGEFL